MARIRSIHPSIWTDEDFVTLEMAARLLFIGVLNECDDQGVFIWKPSQLKMRLLPSDNVDVVNLLEELMKAGFIRRYCVNGAAFGAVRHFREFQRPKKPNAVHPTTDEIRCFSGPKADHNSPPVGNPGGTNGKVVPGEFPQERSTGGERGMESPPEGRPPRKHRPAKQQIPEFRGGFGASAAADMTETLDGKPIHPHPRGASVVPIPRRAVGG
jgi:hypothetical protein